ncbi:MAG: HU family DNA-binding protein [Tychonema bourrellyi B0820]|nr:HU family DNA-binding protein [Tychonema bourrellyi B0820]PJE45226.1 MAG: integration host factor subunit alpha [Flavobacterium sp.] [Flavobacterium sp. FEMGT703F]
MNRSELVKIVAVKLEVSQVMVNSILGEIIETIEETVADGEEVLLVGFGTFKSRLRKARKCRNPQNNEPVQVAETTIPVFKPGKKLKDRVKNLS